MEQFSDNDRERTIDLLRKLEAVDAKVDRMLDRQAHTMRLQRRLAKTITSEVVKQITASVSKRALFLIGLGMMIGSAMGGAAMELARQLVARALGGG